MKKILLLFALVGGFALTSLQAQHCAGKMKTASAEVKSASTESAAQAAALDPTIEMRQNAQTGEVSYLRKNVCQESGKVSYTSVDYCAKSGKFIAAQPGQCTKGGAASMVAQEGAKAAASCCAKGEKVAEKSSCCSSAQKAACSKAKMKTETLKTEQTKKVKLVKSGV